MKDMFVDNCAATNFANPLEQEYKPLIEWLLDEGFLAVSNRLLAEYGRTSGGCAIGTNIWLIVSHLQARGRLRRFTTSQLNGFLIPKSVARKLQSNLADHVHIKTVLLSHRKYTFNPGCEALPGHKLVSRAQGLGR